MPRTAQELLNLTDQFEKIAIDTPQPPDFGEQYEAYLKWLSKRKGPDTVRKIKIPVVEKPIVVVDELPFGEEDAPPTGDKLDRTAAKKEKKKLDPKAKTRNRGTVCVPAENAKDHKDHFPINDAGQARNALARVHQYSSSPDWWKGSLKGLQDLVARKVKAKYPKIDVGGKDKKKKSSVDYLLAKYDMVKQAQGLSEWVMLLKHYSTMTAATSDFSEAMKMYAFDQFPPGDEDDDKARELILRQADLFSKIHGEMEAIDKELEAMASYSTTLFRKYASPNFYKHAESPQAFYQVVKLYENGADTVRDFAEAMKMAADMFIKESNMDDTNERKIADILHHQARLVFDLVPEMESLDRQVEQIQSGIGGEEETPTTAAIANKFMKKYSKDPNDWLEEPSDEAIVVAPELEEPLGEITMAPELEDFPGDQIVIDDGTPEGKKAFNKLNSLLAKYTAPLTKKGETSIVFRPGEVKDFIATSMSMIHPQPKFEYSAKGSKVIFTTRQFHEFVTNLRYALDSDLTDDTDKAEIQSTLNHIMGQIAQAQTVNGLTKYADVKRALDFINGYPSTAAALRDIAKAQFDLAGQDPEQEPEKVEYPPGEEWRDEHGSWQNTKTVHDMIMAFADTLEPEEAKGW